MSQTINVNGESINYPETGDTNWGDEATQFAVQTSAALGKIGLSSGTTVDITSTLDVTGATTLDSTLTVAGTTTLNGNTNLGNALISGTLGVTGNSTFTGDVIASIVKASGSGGLTIDSNGGTDVALFGAGGGSGTTLYGGLNGTTATFSGVIYADDDTTANTPVISFTGDTNTGIGRSAADTLDLITNGNSRFRIEPTGQIKAVYESSLGTDYNTTLHNGYLCRAWVNFDGTSSNLTGTYSRTGTTITISITSHGLTSGQSVYLDFTTGTGTDGIYIVTVVDANSYTVTDTVSGSTSGNVTQFRYIRASGNVSSITDNGTGDYTVNFTTAMPDINYCTTGATGLDASSYPGSLAPNRIGTTGTESAPTTASVRVNSINQGINSASDQKYIFVAVFR